MTQILLLAMLSSIPNVVINSPIPAELAGQDLSVKLSNESDVPIVAMVTIWTIAEKHGAVVGSMKINHEFYTGESQIDPHSSVKVSYANILNDADPSKLASIEVDSVLFADGTVLGRNKFGLDKYIEAKWAERDRIARGLLAFKGKEDQIKAWLEGLAKEVPVGLPYPPSNWQFYNHRAGIVSGWVDLFSQISKDNKDEFWKAIDELTKGSK